MLCDQLWRRRVLHISIDRGPRFRDAFLVARVVFDIFRDGVVEGGKNVRRLKVDNTHVGIGSRDASDVTLMIKPLPRERIALKASRIN